MSTISQDIQIAYSNFTVFIIPNRSNQLRPIEIFPCVYLIKLIMGLIAIFFFYLEESQITQQFSNNHTTLCIKLQLVQ